MQVLSFKLHVVLEELAKAKKYCKYICIIEKKAVTLRENL